MIAKLALVCGNTNKSVDINKYKFNNNVIRSLHFEYILAIQNGLSLIYDHCDVIEALR